MKGDIAMKKESNGKKSLLWLWILIGVLAVLAIAGGILAFLFLGQPGEEGEPEKIFSELYWNVDREKMVDAETGLSARESAADGMYHMRVAVNGELKEVKIADKKLVNRLDMLDVFGLKFDTDGTVVDMIAPEEIYTKIAEKVFVQFIEGNTITVNTSQALNGMQIKLELTSDVMISNVGHLAETPGMIDELEIMDQIVIYGLEEKTPSDIFILNRFWESEVYWRVKRFYNSTTKTTTRKQNEDGYWYVDFAVNGKQVTLRTNVEEVINAIDGYSVNTGCCGLVFDEEGNIIDCFNAAMAARGAVMANNYDVTELSEDGKTFTATRILFGNDVGKTYTGTITEDTKIFNVNSSREKFVGEVTELKKNDRLYIIGDTYGNPKIIYVVNRMVDSPMYYLQNRTYSSVNGCTAVPDANGWYTLKFAAKGKEYVYRTKDFDLVTQINTYGYQLMGLKVENGIVKASYEPQCVSGNYSFAGKYFVTGFADPMISCTSTSGATANGILAENCEVYDVSGCGKFVGAKTTLRVGDRVICYTNASGEVTHVYIINRKVAGTTLFWKVETMQYNSKTKETTRTRDADGYYTYQMIKAGGKEMTVKTKSKAVASKIDSYSSTKPVALKVNSKGIVTDIYPGWAWNGGYFVHSAFWITGKHPTEPNTYKDIASTGAESTLTLQDNCKIYNVSLVYNKYRGESTTLKAGDKFYAIAGQDGKVQVVLVYEREANTKIYRRVSYELNEETGVYTFKLAVDGKVKEFTCANETVAKKILDQSLGFGLRVSGTKIQQMYAASAAPEVWAGLVSYYDVTKISGRTVTVKRNKPGQTDTGKTAEFTMAPNCKVYMWDQNVTPNARGKAAKLQVGDRIYAYKNNDGEATIIYIENECTHAKGGYGYCSHCGKTVWWEPITAGFNPVEDCVPKTAHFYLPADLASSGTTRLADAQQLDKDGNVIAKTDMVLDLYGHTWTRMGVDETVKQNVLDPEGNPVLDAGGNPVTESVKTGRRTVGNPALSVGNGNKLTIIDTKKGGGFKLEEGAVTTGSSFMVIVSVGSKLIVNAGTYDATMAKSDYSGANAGCISVNGELVVNGGTFKGIQCSSTKSGSNSACIGSWSGSSITINGGTFTAAQAGDEYVGSAGAVISANGNLTINGGTFTGGRVRNHGGIIYGGGKTNLVINGGTFTGGYAGANGGNICTTGPSTVITGGTITGGIADGAYGDNVYIVSNDGVVSITDKAKIDGGVSVRSTDATKPMVLNVADKIVIDKTGNENTFYDLQLENTLVTIDNSADSTEITTPVEAWLVYDAKDTVIGIGYKNYELPWIEWTDSTKLPTNGKVKLMTDITTENPGSVDSLILDLNGHDITVTAPAEAVTTPFLYTVAGSLQILDSSSNNVAEQGVISLSDKATTSADAGMIRVNSNAEFILDGGTLDGTNITSTYATANTGLVTVLNDSKTVDEKQYVYVGTFTMNGGVIKGMINTSTASGKSGSCVGGRGGTTININGGKLICAVDGTNKVAATGGCVATGGILNITGGELIGGQVKNHGGAIYAATSNYTGRYWADGTPIEIDDGVTITGGTITGGTVNSNGGAIQSSANLTIGGNAIINAGTAGSNGDAIDVASGAVFTVKDQAQINGEVTIRSATTKLVVADEITMDDIRFVDTAKYYIGSLEETATTAEAGAVYELTYDGSGNVNGLQKKVTTEPEPEPGDAAWTEWTSDTALPTAAGSYRLTKNVTVDAATKINSNVTIDLNGFDITRNVDVVNSTSYVFLVDKGGNLTITDLSGKAPEEQGTVSIGSAITTNAYAGLIMVTDNEAATSFTLNGGILDGTNVTSTYKNANNGVITAFNSNSGIINTININGGIIRGQKNTNTGTGQGSSCIGGGGESVININGGKLYGYKYGDFSANVCASGACVSSNSQVNITGGDLYGSRTASRGGAVSISGGSGYVIMTGGTIYSASGYSGGVMFLGGSGASSITGGTVIDGISRTAGQGDTIDLFNGTLTIGGNAVVHGGIYARGTGKLVVTGSPVIDESLGKSTYCITNAAGVPIYLDSTSGTALTTTAGDYQLTYGTDGKVNGIAANVKMTDWTETTSLPTDGAIKLTAPVTLSGKVTLTGNLTVDLNGQSITRTVAAGGTDAQVFSAPAGTVLTVIDTNATPATIKAEFANTEDKVTSDAGLISIAANAIGYIDDVTIDGNNIVSTYSSANSGVVTVGGKLIFNGGTIKGQYNRSGGSGKSGGCIGGQSASLIIINGGTLEALQSEGTNYTVTTGGCVSTKGDMIINGGTLIGGRAANHGGAIYTDGGASKYLIINGGTIMNGRAAANGGNIQVGGVAVTINGGTITGGQKHIGTGSTTRYGDNIDFASGAIVTINGGTITGGISLRTTSTTMTVNGGKIDAASNDPALSYNIEIAAGTLNAGSKQVSAAGNYSVTYDCMGNVSGYVSGTQAYAKGAHTGTGICTVCGAAIS